MARDELWEDSRRIEAWAAEVRVNLIRLAAIIAFYGNHLIQVVVLGDSHRSGPDGGALASADVARAGHFHISVTTIALTWAIEVLILHVCLSRRYLPDWLKYAATSWDIVMVTLLLVVAGTPRTPLTILYFLVIAAAPLRLSLRFVYVATLGSMVAYVLFLGYYKYLVVGIERYYRADTERLTRVDQTLFVLALGAAGVLAGQMVRQARRLAHGYPVAADKGGEG